MAEAALTPQLRALPGGGHLGLLEGRALKLRAEEGAYRLAGDALLGPVPEPRPPRPVLPEMPLAQRKPRRGGLAALHLSYGGVALALPAELSERVAPMPALRPVPGAPPEVLGIAEAGGTAVLVLDTVRVAGLPEAPLAEEPSQLVLLSHAGRRFGLPASRVEAGPEIPALAMFRAWLEGPEGAACLRLAPPTTPPAAPPAEARRELLVFTAGGREGALPAEAVLALLPPLRPLPTPHRGLLGLAQHRGEVLPVLDVGPRLGGTALAPGAAAPLIRLVLPGAPLLAVSAVAGVQAAPLARWSPAGGDLLAYAGLGEGAPLPVHLPQALCRLP